MKQIRFRKAILSDAPMLFAWRNDPETRAASLDTQEIPWATHRAWYITSLRSAKRFIYIAIWQGEAIGMVRFDELKDGLYEMSWLIDPAFRGRGLGKLMVQRAKDLHLGDKTCRVKSDNEASLKIAEAAELNVTLVG